MRSARAARGTVARRAGTRRHLFGAHNRIRTGDLFLTKEVLYRLSYMGLTLPARTAGRSTPVTDARTPPSGTVRATGAGDGDRTHIISLEG